MRTVLIALTAAALLIAPAACLAAGKPEDEAAARRMELSRRYVEAVKLDEQMELLMDQMLPPMMAGFSRDLPAKDRAAFIEVVRESMNAMMPQMVQSVVVGASEVFTEDELKAAVAFFESPQGRSMTDKGRVLSDRLEQDMVTLLPQLETELKTRLCAKLGVGAGCAAPPAVSKS